MDKKIDTFHEKDDILGGITYEDLITAVTCNEKEINERTVMKAYNELLKERLENASEELGINFARVVEICKSYREEG